MMKEDNTSIHPMGKDENFNIQELIFKFLVHWPWIVAATVICLALAYVHIYITPPTYNVSATVLIKDDKKGGGSHAMGGLEGMGLSGLVGSSQSFENEIEVLRSKSLLKEVVTQLNLYITYQDVASFPKQDLYRRSPVTVSFTSQEATALSGPISIDMDIQPDKSLNVVVNTGESSYEKHFDKLPAVLPTNKGTLAFFPAKDSTQVSSSTKIKAMVHIPMQIAKGYGARLSIGSASKVTSVALVSVHDTNKQRGRDFINKLIEVYNFNTNKDKNEVAQKTAEFIDERIRIISKELGSTEADLESFKRTAGITDLNSDAQIALTGNAEYEKKRAENRTQINLVQDLIRYMANNEYEVLPSNIGLQDISVSSAIERYNELIMERKRLMRTSTEDNPAIINLSSSIQTMRANVQTSLQGALQGLQIARNDLDREVNKFSRRISNAPGQERQLVSISRQQEIKAGLYLMLLQKREENAIMLAATANNAKIIDEAIADDGPIAPKKRSIYLMALAIGLLVPIGIIYLLDLMRYKIEAHADVEKLTRVTIAGDIPLMQGGDSEGSIVVFENKNNMMSETFRHIRTNLQFMLQEGKVILFTSTVSGEGKSFVSANLALSLSYLGKKVVIVGLDIRKPGLNKIFKMSTRERGITQFLANPNLDILELVQPSTVSQNLYILPGGLVPPNPTELLAKDSLEKAIEELKKEFDYVILDTAPVGMVTDTLLIGRVADISVYVCRADYTRKAEFVLVNDLANGAKLPNMCVVINGVDLRKKKYGYYGNARHYGYARHSGYGIDPHTSHE